MLERTGRPGRGGVAYLSAVSDGGPALCGTADPIRVRHLIRPGAVVDFGPGNAIPVTDGNRDEILKSALLAEAEGHGRPMRIVARQTADGFAADLLAVDGRVMAAGYGAGPDELLAVLVAEQRYLVEQGGHGRSVAGETYLDKARERIRRGPSSRP